MDRAVGAYLTGRHDAAGAGSEQRRVIAVDGKALKGSAHLTATRRHLLSAVTHDRAMTLAQAEVGAKTNETTHFRSLLEPLDLQGALVTFDALHSVQANVTWLVETKNAHYIAVIKANQPTAHRQLAALPWRDIRSSTLQPPPDTAAASPAPSRPAASRTNSAGSPSLTTVWPSASTAAAGRLKFPPDLGQRLLTLRG
ncbi:ISAs1 family transposase [Streptomyces capillispiralis]|uniref:ISAs1 family transposase n=1 Tax=Streptomyces capillispiralis TaxID=68182 RepID=UPI0036A2E007